MRSIQAAGDRALDLVEFAEEASGLVFVFHEPRACFRKLSMADTQVKIVEMSRERQFDANSKAAIQGVSWYGNTINKARNASSTDKVGFLTAREAPRDDLKRSRRERDRFEHDRRLESKDQIPFSGLHSSKEFNLFLFPVSTASLISSKTVCSIDDWPIIVGISNKGEGKPTSSHCHYTSYEYQCSRMISCHFIFLHFERETVRSADRLLTFELIALLVTT
jgi:hypothetical protein